MQILKQHRTLKWSLSRSQWVMHSHLGYFISSGTLASAFWKIMVTHTQWNIWRVVIQITASFGSIKKKTNKNWHSYCQYCTNYTIQHRWFMEHDKKSHDISSTWNYWSSVWLILLKCQFCLKVYHSSNECKLFLTLNLYFYFYVASHKSDPYFLQKVLVLKCLYISII